MKLIQSKREKELTKKGIPALEKNISLDKTGAQDILRSNLRTGSHHFLSIGKILNSLAADQYVSLIFSINPNACLCFFIIIADKEVDISHR